MKFFLIKTKSLKGKKKKNSKTSNKNIKNNFKLKLVEIINFFLNSLKWYVHFFIILIWTIYIS